MKENTQQAVERINAAIEEKNYAKALDIYIEKRWRVPTDLLVLYAEYLTQIDPFGARWTCEQLPDGFVRTARHYQQRPTR